MTKRGLVMCRTGMGSSMMLRIKLEKVISKNKFPLELKHDVLSGFSIRDTDLIITMEDLVDEFKNSGIYVIGIRDIMDMEYMEEQIGRASCRERVYI